MKFDWTQGELAEGLRRYDAGEFFAAHEAWESVWLRSREAAKTFLQGLIQVAAVFHHLEHHNPLGTALLPRRALRRIERYPAHFGGISGTLLCDDIRERLQALEAGVGSDAKRHHYQICLLPFFCKRQLALLWNWQYWCSSTTRTWFLPSRRAIRKFTDWGRVAEHATGPAAFLRCVQFCSFFFFAGW